MFTPKFYTEHERRVAAVNRAEWFVFGYAVLFTIGLLVMGIMPSVSVRYLGMFTAICSVILEWQAIVVLARARKALDKPKITPKPPTDEEFDNFLKDPEGYKKKEGA